MYINISKCTCPLNKKSRHYAKDSGMIFPALIAFCLIAGVFNFAQTGFTIGANIEKVRKRCNRKKTSKTASTTQFFPFKMTFHAATCRNVLQENK